MAQFLVVVMISQLALDCVVPFVHISEVEFIPHHCGVLLSYVIFALDDYVVLAQTLLLIGHRCSVLLLR